MMRFDVIAGRCDERLSTEKHLIDFEVAALPTFWADETRVGYAEVACGTRGVYGFVSSFDVFDEERSWTVAMAAILTLNPSGVICDVSTDNYSTGRTLGAGKGRLGMWAHNNPLFSIVVM